MKIKPRSVHENKRIRSLQQHFTIQKLLDQQNKDALRIEKLRAANLRRATMHLSTPENAKSPAPETRNLYYTNTENTNCESPEIDYETRQDELRWNDWKERHWNFLLS